MVLLNKYKNNLCKSWGVMKDIITNKKRVSISDTFNHNGNLITDKQSICEHFNDYFINIGQTLAKKIPKSNAIAKSFLQGNFPRSLFLKPTNSNEMILTI